LESDGLSVGRLANRSYTQGPAAIYPYDTSKGGYKTHGIELLEAGMGSCSAEAENGNPARIADWTRARRRRRSADLLDLPHE
jgi:hypothetical protein